MIELQYVPAEEFDRVRALKAPAPEVAALFANLCRINTLYMITRAGSGHIGSSFSSLDVVAWLYLNELSEADVNSDVYFSSKGHDVPGLYAVLTALGKLDFEQIHCLRALGGLPGHPDVGTPHMATNSGPLGMGISKAKGMALARRLQGQTGRFFVLTGDGELQEGQIWESLTSAANQKLGEITVIVDHNKVQSDTLVERVSDLGDLERRFSAFGWHVARCDGHDLEALRQTLAALEAVKDVPKVIIADTIKGRGVSFMEHTAMKPTDRLYRFHSGAPDDETYLKGLAELIALAGAQLAAVGEAPLKLATAPRPAVASAAGKQRLMGAYARALVEQGERNPTLVVLDADLALDCGLLAFEERFPERFVECGIAEQDMVSQAGGMALRGLLPIAHSFSCFLSTRPNEQIYNNATERSKVIYVAPLAGMVPGGPGHSHQSVRDIATLGAIPGLVMIEPSSEREVGLALDYLVNGTAESGYLRLVSIPCAVNYELPSDYALVEGQGVSLTEGEDGIIFGYGPVLLPEACQAAKLLREKYNLGLKVINLPWLNRLDADWLRATVQGYTQVFTLDNHYRHGGQGEMIAAQLAELGVPNAPRVVRFGLTEIPACGRNDEVLRHHGLDAESLASRMAEVMRPVPA
jgi:transketolase